MNLKKAFWVVFSAVILVKIWVALVIPMTGDEAYYVVWGKHLSGGYYDQPPMVGWLIHVLLWFSDSKLWIRLPALLLSPFIVLGLRTMLRGLTQDREKADLGAMLFLLAPIPLLAVFTTTDTPLIYFMFGALLILEKALRRQKEKYYFGAGLLIGLGLLSKYFALLIPVAFGIYILFTPKKKNLWKGLAWMCVGILPSAVFHLYWNYDNCWVNFLFNLHSRSTHETGFAPAHFVTYLGYQIYLMTPFLIYALYKRRKDLVRSLQNDRIRLFALFFVVPAIAFGISALKHGQGLHWMLGFYPAFFAIVAYVLSARELRMHIRWMSAFLGLHLLAVVVLSVLPTSAFKGKSFYNNLLLFRYTDTLTDQLESFKGDYHFATDSYTLAAILSYSSRQNFSVFGMGGRFGREDDLITDFRALSGKNILLFSRLEREEGEFAKYFEQVEKRKISANGIEYTIFLGHGFHYRRYRDEVLRPLKDTYYQIPAGLPVRACYFLDRYFAGD
jgi:4-amino-4-deoxy-L-arabinose transferase-like glycosyltransferase